MRSLLVYLVGFGFQPLLGPDGVDRCEAIGAERGASVRVVRTAEPEFPRERKHVFIRIEFRGDCDPESLPDRALLRSKRGSWRAVQTFIGMPARDPLGVRTRGPILLFEVPPNPGPITLELRGSETIRLEIPKQVRRVLE